MPPESQHLEMKNSFMCGTEKSQTHKSSVNWWLPGAGDTGQMLFKGKLATSIKEALESHV